MPQPKESIQPHPQADQVENFRRRGVTLVMALWLAWFVLQVIFAVIGGGGLSVATMGPFGDTFGVINALFTGLAFVAVFWTGQLQRQQLAMQWQEMVDERHKGEAQRIAMRNGQLEAIAVDVLLASRYAVTYIVDAVQIPAYRLPLYGSQSAFPALLTEGALPGDDAMALAQFYLDAESFNRSLDIAQRLADSGSSTEMEGVRAQLKAGRLLPGSPESSRDQAIAVLRRHLPTEAAARIGLPKPNAELTEREEQALAGAAMIQGWAAVTAG